MLFFGLAYAFVYGSVASARPTGVVHRGWRLATIMWLSTLFSEFMGMRDNSDGGERRLKTWRITLGNS
jgi:hypothetical protein